jgi:hypothetical protein
VATRDNGCANMHSARAEAEKYEMKGGNAKGVNLTVVDVGGEHQVQGHRHNALVDRYSRFAIGMGVYEGTLFL